MTSNINGGAGASTIGATSKLPWFTTWRVRAGYPVGSVMPYVTGGAVWGRQTLEGNDSANGGYFNVSNNFWTYTFGGGIEGRQAADPCGGNDGRQPTSRRRQSTFPRSRPPGRPLGGRRALRATRRHPSLIGSSAVRPGPHRESSPRR